MTGLPEHPHADRRARLLERLGADAMVLGAAPVLHRSWDTEERYRPDSNLLYLTGLEEPGIVAVFRAWADEERVVLFARPRDPEAELWSGARVGPEGLQERCGADAAYPVSELEDRLPELLHGAGRVHFRLGQDDRLQPLVEEALRWSRFRGQRKGEGPRGVVDPGEILHPMRRRKDEAELARIRRAIQITEEGFAALEAEIAPGVGEWELEAAIESTFRRSGARGPAFPTIVASGPNACVLHYVENNRTLEDGELILVDAGADFEHYSGDLTRTYPVSGALTPAQEAIHTIVAEAGKRAFAAARPGAPVSALHQAAVRRIAEGLVDLGILEGEIDGLIEAEAYKPYFPHQTSHWLGLDVHDPGDYAESGKPVVLEPGMVLTIEPGLYFGARAIERDEGDARRARPYTGIGVRLESDLIVGEG